MNALARMLVLAPPQPRSPRIVIAFPLEGTVDVEFECRQAELSRLIDDVVQDEARVDLISAPSS